MRRLFLFFFFLIAGVLVFYTALTFGSVPFSLSDLLFPTDIERVVLYDIRLPRILTAFLVGSCLAIAGAAFQGILQNPLADPYVLGVSAGAGLGAAAGVLLSSAVGFSLLVPVLGFAGAAGTIFLVQAIVFFSRQTGVTAFILAGIVVNAFFSAVMMALLFLSGDRLAAIMQWLLGDLSRLPVAVLGWLYVVVAVGMVLLMLLAYPITILATGDEQAYSLGISVRRLREGVFVLSSMLTAIAVASGGIIGFVGLIVPHFLRLFIADDFRYILPLSALAGGLFLVLADTLCRSLAAPAELPVGIVTALVGGPVFVTVMIRMFRRHD